MTELINLIIVEPAQEGADEATRFKLPHISAEILSCEISQLTSAIAGDQVLLDKLYSFMEQEAPLNPLLASFFSKAFGVLITRNSKEVSF